MKQLTIIFTVMILVLSNNFPQAHELNMRHPKGIVMHANVSKKLDALIPYDGFTKYSVRSGFVIWLAIPANVHHIIIVPNNRSLTTSLKLENIERSVLEGNIRDGIFENEKADPIAAITTTNNISR